MFTTRQLNDPVAAVRDEACPDALVFDAERDFETLPPAQAEELGLVVDGLSPTSYPSEWLPDTVPDALRRYAGSDFTIGMPGDGSVVWTRQTEPPVVIVKPRLQGSPESFVDFLLAAAFVELETGVPEHFLGFFEGEYCDLEDAVPLGAADTYQIGTALFDGWVGLQSRDTFADWLGSRPALGEAWQDAGEHLESRVGGLPSAVARGETSFADATELACAAIKHGIELPAPFSALDTAAYRDTGPEYALTWAEKTFDALEETE